MSKSSKSALSGLGSFKREWSSSAHPSSSPEVLIPWEPTQASKPPLKPPSKPLTPSERRLIAIQEALAGYSAPPPPPLIGSTAQNNSAIRTVIPPALHPPPLARTQNKRVSPTSSSDALTQKRARQLPPDWLRDDVLSMPSLSSASSSTKSLTSTSSTPSEPKKVAPVFLSQEQTKLLKLVQNGESVFYTGSAGTGKSVLLREIVKALRKKHSKTPDAVAITASTGIAACNIGGVTIHSFAGIGLGTEPPETLVARIKKNKKSASRWARTKVLIIDEVSMLEGDLFDKLEKIARILRRSQEPFGGIQLVVTGDFFQLPPVSKGNAVKFAFEAETWKQAVRHTFNLTKVFRQSDEVFIRMLNEMRFGNLSESSIRMFRSLREERKYDDGMGPTELFPRREEVERSNLSRLSRLTTQGEDFYSIDGGTIQDPSHREKLLSNFMAPRHINLRVDAQVMLIKNVDETLVNGSMGRILRFVDPAIYGTEQDREQSGEGGVVGATSTTPGAVAKKSNSAALDVKMYPVVEFVMPSGARRRVLVMPEIWKLELPNGEVQVSRTQLPLILAWAMSIHKSQGQTLDRVKVDLGRVFEKGQAYVALSRATSLQGLQVLNFDPAKVQVHPKVVAWSKTLSTIM